MSKRKIHPKKWKNTLLVAAHLKPLPRYLTQDEIHLGWDDQSANILRESCRYYIGLRDPKIKLTIAGAPLETIDFIKISERFDSTQSIDLDLLEKLISYRYRKGYGVDSINHNAQ